jgi:hypothetical protein
MIGQNLRQRRASFGDQAYEFNSLRCRRIQSEPIMLRELRSDKCCPSVPRSGLFPNPRHVYSMSPSNIRLTPDSGRNPCLIPWREDAGKPIGTSLATNRGTSCFTGLSGRAASADSTRENIRLSAGSLRVIALTGPKPQGEAEFYRISGMQASVRKNPHPASVKNRSWGSTFAARSAASIGRESRYVSGQCCSQAHGKARYLGIPKMSLESPSEGTVRLAGVIEK